ncbi:SGNH/GDSL hydrolase family protein [Bacillus sp. B-jedd]|uniref:SGNH/GDSL hydrolase family protein n=1 Tax=Bacillus sp. B-jedd TaxID=1476857 RepID=UPI0005156784|nr:GDSL-type esterase/lipase family protein [Bacillus sp. B-jedd]CEG27370.1 lipolytic protein [Bacillus sp. B-jedd]
MNYSKLRSVLVFILLFGTIFAPAVSAENVGGKKLKIVALGDSITFGWNLGTDKTKPSDYAFPGLIGERDHKVTNLSKTGWTSTQLLTAMEHEPAFADAIKKADVVTLNIGSNDLMQAAGLSELIKSGKPVEVTPEMLQKVQAAVYQLKINLNSILANIRAKTDAPVILYTLYNPFGLTSNPVLNSFHFMGESFIGQVNGQVINPSGKLGSILIADAYSAYNGKQAQYILPGDIHPTVDGQYALAKLAEQQIVALGDPKVKLKFAKQ